MKLTVILLCAAVAANVFLYAMANEMEEEDQENEFGDVFQDNVADLDDELDLADFLEAALNDDDLDEEAFEKDIEKKIAKAIMKSVERQGAKSRRAAAPIVKQGEAAYEDDPES